MPFFDELFTSPAQTRLTGIRMAAPRADDSADAELGVHYLVVPDRLDAATESGFLEAFLPFWVGGFVGRASDGSEWIVILQQLSTGTFATRCDGDALTVMQASLDRALALSPDLVLDGSYALSSLDLRDYYAEDGVAPGTVSRWSTRSLVRGLVAEMCGFPLASFARCLPQGCAFPGSDHDCEGDAADDVYARWVRSGRILDVPPSPTATTADAQKPEASPRAAASSTAPTRTRPTGRQTTLWSTSTLSVWAYLDGADLILAGHDTGPSAGHMTMDGEYEYTLRVDAADVPTIVAALGGQPGDDVLPLLQAAGQTVAHRGERQWLLDLGIHAVYSSR